MGGAQTRVLHGEMALLAGSTLTKLGLFEGKLAAVRELFRRYLSVCLIEVDRVAEAGMEGVRGGKESGRKGEDGGRDGRGPSAPLYVRHELWPSRHTHLSQTISQQGSRIVDPESRRPAAFPSLVHCS